MSWYVFLQSALILGLLALIAFIIYVLVQLHRTLRTFNDLLENVNRDLPLILSKLQLTLDGVNSEMARVEQVVNSFQEVGARVQSTTGMVQRAVSSPLIRLSSLASGAKTALASFIRSKKS